MIDECSMDSRLSPSSPNPRAIYAYDDYRAYLRDRFDERKERDTSFTHRTFAAEAGFSNPGFLNDVIKGRRKLSAAAVGKMIAGFRLSPNEAEFFRLLVAYGQSRDDAARQKTYRRMTVRRNRSAFARLNPALSRYYQDYRYPLVRTAVMCMDFRGDYEALGRFIHPPLPAARIKKYIRELCEWGLLTQGSDGRYRATDRFVEPPSTLAEQLTQLNRDWIDHAAEALVRLPSDKRNMSTMLLSVSGEIARAINEKLEKVRSEIWEMVKDDKEDASCVMQLNIQYFPRSKNKEQRR
jgi:uncharacterized protein (TIGR02147 family)